MFQQAGIGIAFPKRDLHLETREPPAGQPRRGAADFAWATA